MRKESQSTQDIQDRHRVLLNTTLRLLNHLDTGCSREPVLQACRKFNGSRSRYMYKNAVTIAT